MWPLKIDQIKRLQLELTTFCNAKCPSCERAKYSVLPEFIYKKQLNSIEVSLEQIKKWIPLDKMKSLMHIHLCGNIDEPTLNTEIFEICKYFEDTCEDHVWIHISTNGGTRNKEFWKRMASLKRTLIIFGIDGLEDTNHIYRKNVKWKKLQDNFRTYIKYGGTASWQFIIFEHNKHQEDEARTTSQNEGFVSFNTVYSSRENYEVEEVRKERESNSCVKCKATYFNYELEESFFVDVRGNVWPCCWMGTNDVTNYEIVPKVGHSFGHFLSHNLNYESFENIINGDMFSHLWENLHTFEVCNQHCKENVSDTFEWEIQKQWMSESQIKYYNERK